MLTSSSENLRRPKCAGVLACIRTILVFAVLLHGKYALACAACGCTLSKDWGIQGISATPDLTADLSYDYTDQNQQRYGSGAASPALISRLQGAGQEIEDYTATRTITTSLNFTGDTWGINAQLPFVQRTHGTFGDSAGYSSASDTGVGDIRIIGRYSGFSEDKSAGAIAGIKLPTGRTDTNFNAGVAAGTPLDPSLQAGTGSADVILGGFLTGSIAEYGWFAQVTVQHAVASGSFDGQDYTPGDAYALNIGIRHAKFGAGFTPMLQLNYIHRQPDSGGAATPADALTGGPATGGTLIYLAPGASLRVGGGTSVYGFIQFPVYQNVNSLQLSPNYILSLGTSHSFD
jgi:hypothetical protein